MPTLLLTHPDCLAHVTPPGHPEQVARLTAILDALAAPEFDALTRAEAPLAEDAHILRAHPEAYLRQIRAAAPAEGFVGLDADTHMSPGSLDAALRAAGANVAAVDAVMAGQAGNAFCATRPPGHHAETATAMGFCLFGNVVIGARHALDAHGLERVAVIDFDVHHGNGTQDLVWDDPRIFFASTHQSPLYPGTGAAHETGACGNVMNVPLPPGTDGAAFRHVMETHVLPAVAAFRPQMVFISAGFDAHEADPLANLNLHEDDFAWATGAICDLADEHAQGRVVSTLEGGYDLDALAASTAAHVRTLMERARD
ncbi:histone deacetylase family protein [Halovulum sp. GXIMD14794]